MELFSASPSREPIGRGVPLRSQNIDDYRIRKQRITESRWRLAPVTIRDEPTSGPAEETQGTQPLTQDSQDAEEWGSVPGGMRTPERRASPLHVPGAPVKAPRKMKW